MNRKLIMYVYNDITTDARVQRAATALAGDFELTLVSIQKGKTIADNDYKNVFVGGHSRGFFNILKAIFATWHLIREQCPDVVYCHDYYSAILAYLLIKTRFSGKIIYDAHELIIPEAGRKDKRLLFFYWFEKRIIKAVDLLICASEERCQIMMDHYRLESSPLVVPNISQLRANDNDPDVHAILESLKDFFAIPKPTVVYAGVVTSSRRIGDLLDAAISMHNDCKLLIVGDGSDLEMLKEKAATHVFLESAFTGALPYKSLGSVLSRCDIGFLYYPLDSLNNRYCASNKIYEYASVGLPILANENPTVKGVLGCTRIGISTDRFEEGIRQIITDREKYKKNCAIFTQSHLWENEAERLRQRVLSLFN